MEEPIEIAIAVVEHEDQFLIGLRPEGAPLAGLWEFPGGKVEPGENPRDAAARECLEETGIPVIIGDEYPEVVHQYDHGKLKLHFFAAAPATFVLPTNERFMWVLRKQLADYKFPDANDALLKRLSDDEESAPRDLKFWLGPAHAITVLIFAGLLMGSDLDGRHGFAAIGLFAWIVGFILLGMSVVNKVTTRGSKFSLRQLFFDGTALCVTMVFAKAIGWFALLTWIPLILLRRL